MRFLAIKENQNFAAHSKVVQYQLLQGIIRLFSKVKVFRLQNHIFFLCHGNAVDNIKWYVIDKLEKIMNRYSEMHKKWRNQKEGYFLLCARIKNAAGWQRKAVRNRRTLKQQLNVLIDRFFVKNSWRPVVICLPWVETIQTKAILSYLWPSRN